ncbi:hypothetical protein rosag_04470 [Roseisolibacter agri]|uniref:FHA domain-containing protein n=1 Tax=Roseisolibacter agri TaxID=2014610 RepID=A0AA37Q042_9BACT|nr:hypothetical protein rosag_04470 [Roseisolibacter agri]
MILEVERADGARSWHRLRSLPLHVGRGYANDVILDDPYVDARHVLLTRDAVGVLVLQDLGSVNGVVADGATVRGQPLVVEPGREVRVGRTTLRFRAADEAVAPALVDASPIAPVAALPLPRTDVPPAPLPAPTRARAGVDALGAWITTPVGSLALVVVAMGAFAFNGWLGSSARASASDAFGGAFAFAAMGALWAGAWALAGRVAVHRLRFVGHVGVAAAGALGALATSIAIGWLTFLFPDRTAVELLSSVLVTALVVAVIAGHLALASTLAPRRRWRNAGIAVGVIIGIGALASLAGDDDAFSDVPSYPGVLKPMPAAWVPTQSVDEFGSVMRELRKDADELAAQQAPERESAPPADSAGR